jgi:hypothetical protein
MPRCKHCKTAFTPKHFNQKNCMQTDECVGAFLSDLSKANDRKWRKEKKERSERLKTRSEWLNDLQKVFNAYIRERDKGKQCISCGVNLHNKTVHASHFWSVGAYPNLRFNENNVHASCDHCNLHLHGNIANYALNLPKRIGQAEFDALNDGRNGAPLKLTVDEIKEKIRIYKDKIKSL